MSFFHLSWFSSRYVDCVEKVFGVMHRELCITMKYSTKQLFVLHYSILAAASFVPIQTNNTWVTVGNTDQCHPYQLHYHDCTALQHNTPTTLPFRTLKWIRPDYINNPIHFSAMIKIKGFCLALMVNWNCLNVVKSVFLSELFFCWALSGQKALYISDVCEVCFQHLIHIWIVILAHSNWLSD